MWYKNASVQFFFYNYGLCKSKFKITQVHGHKALWWFNSDGLQN